MTLSEKTLTLSNGKLVHYWEDGEQFEETVLLLHGGLGNAYVNWHEVTTHLSDTFHVIAPDLPGYGQSDTLHITIQNLVDWIKGILDELQLEQVVLVGHSFGGLVARIFASKHPKYVPALVLVNGGVIPAIPAIAKLIARMPIVGSLLYNQIAKSTTSFSGLQGAIKTESVLTMEFRDAVRADTPALAKLMRLLSTSPIPPERVPPLPVFLLWGEEDSVTPRVVGEHIHENLPGSKLSLIAGVGHMPQVEAPDVFDWQIKQFLNQLSLARRAE